jgi:hypothetical protein
LRRLGGTQIAKLSLDTVSCAHHRVGTRIRDGLSQLLQQFFQKIWQSSPSKRRITLIVQYIAKDGKDGDEDSARPVPSPEREKPSAG